MNSLLEVCLVVTLVTGLRSSLAAQPNVAAAPPMQKGIRVQLAVTGSALSMPDADQQDALIVVITRDGSVYAGPNPSNSAALERVVRDSLSTRPDNKLYIKADARAPYAEVIKVLAVVRAAGVEAPNLLAAQRNSPALGTFVIPRGLQVFLGSPSQAIVVHLSNSEQSGAVLKLDGEQVPRVNVRSRLVQLFQNRSAKVVQVEADGTLPFADVVDVIDVCRSTGARVVLATPAL